MANLIRTNQRVWLKKRLRLISFGSKKYDKSSEWIAKVNLGYRRHTLLTWKYRILKSKIKKIASKNNQPFYCDKSHTFSKICLAGGCRHSGSYH